MESPRSAATCAFQQLHQQVLACHLDSLLQMVREGKAVDLQSIHG